MIIKNQTKHLESKAKNPIYKKVLNLLSDVVMLGVN